MSAALSWKTFIFFAWCPGSCRRAGAGSFHALLVAQLSLLCSHLLQCLQPRLRGLPPQSLVNPVSLLAFSTATDHLLRANSSDSKVLEVLFRKDLKAWTAPGREVQADRGDTAVPGPTHQARCCPCRRDRAWAIHQELSLVLCTSTQTPTSCQTAGTTFLQEHLCLQSSAHSQEARRCAGSGHRTRVVLGTTAPATLGESSAFPLPAWKGPSPHRAEQSLFPSSPLIVLPSPLLTYL